MVQTLAASGNDVYAGGDYSRDATLLVNNIAKWNGTSWTALGTELKDFGGVFALALYGSDVYVGGYFTAAGETAASSIAKWKGNSWSALSAPVLGLNNIVTSLAVSGSDVYASGEFTSAGGNAANYIAKWNGSSWIALGSGVNSYVYALAVSGSDVYAGGAFTTAGGTAANRIAKWNGSSWTPLGSGMDDPVYALAVSGSDVYAGGNFSTAGGNTASRIAKWNGNTWIALGSGINGIVRSLAVSGSDLYAGGNFTNAGGTAANSIAKWNGSTWTALGSGMNNWVYALAVSGSDVYSGGDFSIAGGIPANKIAKWNGSSWTALGSGLTQVYGYTYPSVGALAVFGNDLYAGGYFTNAGGAEANYIAKWNGSSWTALGSGIAGGIDYISARIGALAVSGSDLYAGGYFTAAGGKVSAYAARANLGGVPMQPPVDLAVENVQFAPASLSAGQSLSVSFRVRNLSANPAPASIARLRLTLDNSLSEADPGLAPLNVGLPALPAGASSNISANVTVPVGPSPAYYYVGVRLDPDQLLNQTNRANDVGISASRLTVLGSPPAAVGIVTSNRTPNAALTTRVAPSNEQLKVFDGQNFTGGTNIFQDRMTIVLTHGWNSDPQAWGTNMAAFLASSGVTNANILAWDWKAAAGTGVNLDLALSQTCKQGEALGKALYDTLGSNYQKEFHFIGHSLGTLVNCAAANYLHGDSKRKPAITKDPQRTHLTLLDEAELANVGGVLINSALSGVRDAVAGSAVNRIANGCYLASPIPERYAWIDNYFSFAGLCHEAAVNVFLPKGFTPNVTAWHAYPGRWYTGTMTNMSGPMGHRWSFERNGLPAPFSNGGLLLQQEAAASDFALRAATQPEIAGICAPLAAGYYGEQGAEYAGGVIADGVFAAGEATAEVGVGTYWFSGLTPLGVLVPTVEFISDWTQRFTLRRRQPAPGNFVFHPAGETPTNALADCYVWVPITIPGNAVGMSFQFRFTGVGEDDFLTAGISNTPLMIIESRFIPETNWVSSGVLNVSPWAGQSVELFLGYSGTSTNEGNIEVQSIQFFTLLGPSLQIARDNSHVVVTWPVSAVGFQLESAESLVGTNSWSAVTNLPSFQLNTLSVTNDASGAGKFFRLRRL